MIFSRRLIDPYRPHDSLIHRLSARWKLIAALLFIACVVLLPKQSWLAYGAACVLLFLIAALSRLSWGKLLIRLLYLEPFSIGIAILALFQQGGLLIFTTMLLKSTLCLFCMIILSGTTSFSEIAKAFRQLRVPALLITSLTLMYRYLFVLLDQMEQMKRARRCRTFLPSRTRSWQIMATVAALLFLRASEKAERIYWAMCARGWKT